MDENQIKYFIEAALLAAGRPLSVDQLQKLFDEDGMPEKAQIRQAISGLLEEYEERGITITEVASGFRIQVDGGMAERLEKLWEERPPRYSRALFETLALIAYRQPMTRGEIEEIRGVSVSTNIIRTLMEREWIRVVGHRDVPGRPAMFGTTRQFLDYFGLKKLDDLPPLADLSDWESLRVQLNLPEVDEDQAQDTAEPGVVTQIPVVEAENAGEPASGTPDPADGEDRPDSGARDAESEEAGVAPSADDDFEPIEVSVWPKPGEAAAAVKLLEAADGDEDVEERKDKDASLTGA